jgi:hypothetical protein
MQRSPEGQAGHCAVALKASQVIAQWHNRASQCKVAREQRPEIPAMYQAWPAESTLLNDIVLAVVLGM